MRYDAAKRAFLVKKYYELKSFGLVQRAWRTQFKNSKAPMRNTIQSLVSRFEQTGSVASRPPTRTMPNERKEERIKRIRDLFSATATMSTRKASRATGIPYKTIHCILKDDLHLKPYKIHDWHLLEPGDYQKRLDFAHFFGGLPKNAASHTLFCDESYFYLTPPVNKQNDRMWLGSKPQDGIERPLHDDKALVWCAISCGQVYGPYFFEETVNQYNYLDMLKNFFWKAHCQAPNFKKYYFVQDGATPHTANSVQNYLKSKFSDRFFTKDIWPPRSPDINPCDFFLWGYLKDRVYNPMPKTVDELKANIKREFKKITEQMLKSTFSNFLKRLETIKELDGGHIEEK
jgi:hypothetical protein